MATAPARNKEPLPEIGSSNYSIAPWSTFFDAAEDVPEFAWPHVLRLYDQMRFGDVQIASILLAGTLPIRRYRWFIMQEGASDQVTEFVADNLSLPIAGKDPITQKRRKNRFSHDFHLRHALLNLPFGHMYFEQVYELDDNNLLRIKKLAPRMPRTLAEIYVEDDGGLGWIRQYPPGRIGQLPNGSSASGQSALVTGGNYGQFPTIKVGQLVAYVNDREGAHWTGRSVLRPCIGNYVVKDRLLRVDAMKHERNGLGVPTIEAPEGASQAMLDQLSAMAQAYKAGEASGGALPYGAKLTLNGTTGSLPDTLASIKYHDESMARSLLEMWSMLGQTQHGARSVGDTLMEPFVLGQQAIAKTYADITTEHVIEDLVDLNWGTSEPAPRLGFEPEKEIELGVADLVTLVQNGLVVVDDELREYIRSSYELPKPSGKQTDPSAPTVKPKAPVTTPPSMDPPTPTEARLQVVGEKGPELVSFADGAIRVVDHQHAAKVAERVVNELKPKPTAGGRELRRQLTDAEIAAGTDFDGLETTYTELVTALVTEWAGVKQDQLNELTEQIVEANGDLEKLALIVASVMGQELLMPRITQAAISAARGAVQEAANQGVTVALPEISPDAVDLRTTAVASVLARSISEVASRKALEFTGNEVTPEQVADRVRDHVNGLSDAFLNEQLGGAISFAQNEGRFTIFESAGPKEVLASEILDNATCSPCIQVDGHRYPTVSDARADYPVSGYRLCEGGLKCRGTAVAVYASESPTGAGV